MRRLPVRRRRTLVVLICISLIVTIIIGIKVHLSVDLDAIHSSADLVKQGLVQYAEDIRRGQEKEFVDARKPSGKHKHEEKSFLDVVHLAAIKKGNEMKNIAAKRTFDKLVEVGFISHDEGDANAKNETFISNHKLKHHENRVRKKVIMALIGVSPELSKHYEDKKEFQCLDGHQKFPMDAVNDDFCDCNDGSDEPGTSACSNGRFYCKKDKKYIQSSRVNDGICDCCDGGDEWKMNKPIGFILPKDPTIRFAPCNDVC